MKYFTYVIYSESHNRFYKGMTQNIEKRLKEHNSGKTSSTKFYAPWRLIYFEEFSNRDDARKKEKFLKSGQGRDFIKQIKT